MVDYFLYCFAMWSCLNNYYLSHPGESGADGTSVVYLCFLAFFLFVLMRNYMVMHYIDNARKKTQDTYLFVTANLGIVSGLERIFRFLILFVVVVSPRGMYQFVAPVIFPIVRLLTDASVAFFTGIGLAVPHVAYTHNSIMHSDMPYYGVVFGILFFIFFLWDMINVIGIQLGVWADRISAKVDLTNSTISDDLYRSFFQYCNFCRRVSQNGTYSDRVEFEGTGYFDGRRARVITSGNVFRIYLSSPKLRERLSGILVSGLIVVLSVYEMAPLWMFISVAAMCYYLINAARNYTSIFFFLEVPWAYVKFPLAYFFSQMKT